MNPIRVLLVDDYKLNIDLLKRIFLLYGNIKVVGYAFNGIDAIKQVERLLPDVVLMDLAMPRMDGLTATREIGRLFSKSRIIIISAYSDTDSVIQAINAGASGFLAKPYKPSELFNAVSDVASGKFFFERDIFAQLLKVLSQKGKIGGDIGNVIITDHSLGRESVRVIKENIDTRNTSVETVKNTEANDDQRDLLLNALLHELGNTISPVPQIIRLAKQSENPLKYLEMIESYINRAVKMVQRLSTPLVSWQAQATNLLEVVSSAKEQVAVPEHIRLEIDIPQEAKIVKGHPEALLSVFVNLMLNAIQVMEGPGVIIVKSLVIEGQWVVTRVTDNGPGIPIEIRDKLFDPFFTTRKKHGGQGLGLWLSKQFIEHLGGKLELEKSELGNGSTFMIKLPLMSDSEKSEAVGEQDES